jgi:hypothetical protein
VIIDAGNALMGDGKKDGEFMELFKTVDGYIRKTGPFLLSHNQRIAFKPVVTGSTRTRFRPRTMASCPA